MWILSRKSTPAICRGRPLRLSGVGRLTVLYTAWQRQWQRQWQGLLPGCDAAIIVPASRPPAGGGCCSVVSSPSKRCRRAMSRWEPARAPSSLRRRAVRLFTCFSFPAAACCCTRVYRRLPISIFLGSLCSLTDTGLLSALNEVMWVGPECLEARCPRPYAPPLTLISAFC